MGSQLATWMRMNRFESPVDAPNTPPENIVRNEEISKYNDANYKAGADKRLAQLNEVKAKQAEFEANLAAKRAAQNAAARARISSGIPMVAPEALGIYGAVQEARQRGVNPMVNWLQRMTPIPVVAPTGNGGEVYNYQTGERYTPEY